MNLHDPNVAQVELIAHALGPLCGELIFVGGCAAGLLMTDPGAAPPRLTYDVDLVVELASLAGYHRMEAEFVRLGFVRDMTADAPICRWRYGELTVDLMPTDPGILGFSNRWYSLVVREASRMVLPGGAAIRLISAPLFLATKFEAFAGRGGSDLLGSHDLEDIINVIGGRSELEQEVARAGDELRAYLADQCGGLLAAPNFMNYLPGMLHQDDTLAARVVSIAERVQRLAGLGRL